VKFPAAVYILLQKHRLDLFKCYRKLGCSIYLLKMRQYPCPIYKVERVGNITV